ncbi:hypothetical protein [Nocardia camponoti]|uniref:PPE domain-containing protein n=1 Tax=Nocardia camponoti TaxID=1616106 RepID=A0A917QEK2_9NOCA|nr:hypothetical protein [Nocardia camponoti]GGK46936.1 hypothetical protein GCM10011591_17780 [Nocardia camponoti]
MRSLSGPDAVDANYVPAIEVFDRLSHAEIHSVVSELDPAALVSAGGVFDAVGGALAEAITNAHTEIHATIADGWRGTGAAAAAEAVAALEAVGHRVSEVLAGVGSRLGRAGEAAEALRTAVPQPDSQPESGPRSLLDPNHAANEAARSREAESARLDAVRAMDTIYTPVFLETGSGVPAFDPLPARGDGGSAKLVGGNGALGAALRPHSTPAGVEFQGVGDSASGGESESLVAAAGLVGAPGSNPVAAAGGPAVPVTPSALSGAPVVTGSPVDTQSGGSSLANAFSRSGDRAMSTVQAGVQPVSSPVVHPAVQSGVQSAPKSVAYPTVQSDVPGHVGQAGAADTRKGAANSAPGEGDSLAHANSTVVDGSPVPAYAIPDFAGAELASTTLASAGAGSPPHSTSAALGVGPDAADHRAASTDATASMTAGAMGGLLGGAAIAGDDVRAPRKRPVAQSAPDEPDEAADDIRVLRELADEPTYLEAALPTPSWMGQLGPTSPAVVGEWREDE